MIQEVFVFPLSFAQERVWFLSQLQPDNIAYNIPTAVHLTGHLDVTALERSLNEIIGRHEALRTTFTMVDGNPKQVIAPTLGLHLPVVDLQELSIADREATARRLATDEARKPFDLAQGPLVRTTLLWLNWEEHVLLVSLHHIIADGWSVSVFFRELSALYQSYSSGKPSQPFELPIQYADFTVWQREWLQGEVFETQLAYWKRHLNGAPVIFELPADHPRPAVQSFRGATQSLILPATLAERLKILNRQEDATLFMTLLAAFQTLLYRYTGQEDIIVGSPIAGRNQVETEELIGFFVNTLALRADLSGNPRFRELVRRVREVTLEAYAHQDLPFEKLVEALQPSRDLSRSPLFQVMFVLQNAPVGTLELPGLTLTPLEIESVTAKFDLTLFMRETAQGLKVTVEYSTDLFEATTITRMLGHFQTLLEGIVADANRRLSELPFLTEAEMRQVLGEWNRTEAEYPWDVCVHELFEAQVERTPDAVALVFEDQQLTYHELNCRANQVARYLRTLGVGPEVLVGLCMERSLEMVVGLLGILKAGGAYVPLDPAYPKERLSFMLEDTQATVLLSQKRLKARLPAHGTQVVAVDTDWELIAQHDAENLTHWATMDNCAYVIYTSGSTGRPKGIAIAHRSTVAFLEWARELYGPEQLTGVLASTSLCFDLSVFELFAPLSWGGTVILAENLLQLSALPTAREITLINTVPSVMAELLRIEGVPPSVRTINLAGEPLPNTLAQHLYQQGAIQQVYNLYGPSEGTTYATCALVKKGARETPPIGRPIANTQIYVLDRYLQPVPVGIPGELYIGGVGLARGYLHQPELTAEQFIPHLFSTEPGARLYKTGDLARYLPDGNLEFLGRLDHQIKLRGFRIELGEIEAVLGQHPAVHQAVVLAREDTPSDTRLVAYVVPQQEPPPTSNALRSFLQQRLPDYMVPSAFVLLAALPMTPNGKLDRQALPPPDWTRPALAVAFVAPRTPLEQGIAEMWQQLLGVEAVGIHDNFFALGGHSLLAVQVSSRLRHLFQVEVPVRSMFEAPTVAELAEHLTFLLDACPVASSLLPPLVPVARDGDLLLSFAQQRLWFLDQLELNSAVYNIPIGVRLTGSLNGSVLGQSLNEIVRRHEILRTTFAAVEAQPVQIIVPTLALTLPIVDLRELPEAQRAVEAQRAAIEEARQPFDLAQGPLLRATLLRLAEEEHVLLLTLHHIVADAWSIGVLMRELAALYKAFSMEKPSPLSDLPIQYADFAHWQRQWLQGEVLETQLAYWKQQLGSSIPVLQLPTDRPRPAVQTYSGATQAVVLPKDLAEALRALSRQEGVTFFMTLLAAFTTLFYRWTGQDDILVGSPIANRHHIETEGLIGFFVNTLPLRIDFSREPSFRELLRRVRAMALEAYTHQDLPFEKLVEELQPERGLSHNPLFQVMFVLQNAPLPTIELPGLTVDFLSLDNRTAKFDLTLFMRDTGTGLRGVLEYNTDLFNPATMTRMLGHLQTLLEGIVGPDQPVSTLPLLTEAERQQLLVEWNDTQGDALPEVCIHELFEIQVEQTPDAIAVVFGSAQLTYRELNRRANQLAHHLRTLGVGPDVLVGLCMERSLGMVISLLGILKTGGAYVPLDPAYPQERLAFMLEDTQAPVLVIQQGVLDRLPTWPIKVVCLEKDWEQIAQESQENLQGKVTAAHLAYVIYTSGSTGQPKGVAISHQAVNRLVCHTNYVHLGPTDVVAQVANCTFDAATFEIWGALLHGARLVMLTTDMILSPHDFAAHLAHDDISVLFLTTALFNHMAREVPTAFRTVRTVLFGGEAVEPRWVAVILQHGPPERLLHVYGPTETTTFASWYLVEDVSIEAMTIPIGRPIANTQLYLLDTHLQPVPLGVPGELYIGGYGVARGYLRCPELTAERFIPHPFSHELGARLYKTGDLARYRPDGALEFLGRLDHQVKLRGFRIELDEIEVVLRQYPAVCQAVVLAWQDAPGDTRLVAYVVSQQEPPPTSSALRSFLQQKLPSYMVPSAFVLLAVLPLTPNGKIDRQALPSPDWSRPALADAFVAPRNTLEQGIAEIWQQLLGVELVGIHDNFFDLGGHSLLAVHLLAHIEKAFGRHLPLATLFQGPTVEQLAEQLYQEERPMSWSWLVPIQPKGSKPPFFCMHGGSGVAHYLGPDQPYYGLQPHGLDGRRVPTTIEDMAIDYIKEIRTVQPEGPYFLGGYSYGGLVAFEMAQQLRHQGQEVALLVLFDTSLPKMSNVSSIMDSDTAPLFSALARYRSKFSRHLMNLRPFGPQEKILYLLQGVKWRIQGTESKIKSKIKKVACKLWLDMRGHVPPSLRHFYFLEFASPAIRGYVPQVYPGRVLIFKAETRVDDPQLSWGRFVAGGLDVREVPGGHRALLNDSLVQEIVAKQLTEVLTTYWG